MGELSGKWMIYIDGKMAAGVFETKAEAQRHKKEYFDNDHVHKGSKIEIKKVS